MSKYIFLRESNNILYSFIFMASFLFLDLPKYKKESDLYYLMDLLRIFITTDFFNGF